jgi:HPt (histidine-containing phosphotransfer) domain-containing protein
MWWNLRSEPSTEFKLRTSPLYAADVKVGPEGWRPAPDAGRISLLEPPGTYTVTLTVGGEKSSQKLNVLKDPHSGGTESDIQTQMRFLTGLRDEMSTLGASVNQIESIRAQLAALEKELGNDDTGKAIRKAADDLAEKLIAAEGRVLQLKLTGRGQDSTRWPPMLAGKIGYLSNEVASSDFAPTTQQVAVGKELQDRGEQFQQEYQQILAKDVTPFNAMLREKSIPNVIVTMP